MKPTPDSKPEVKSKGVSKQINNPMRNLKTRIRQKLIRNPQKPPRTMNQSMKLMKKPYEIPPPKNPNLTTKKKRKPILIENPPSNTEEEPTVQTPIINTIIKANCRIFETRSHRRQMFCCIPRIAIRATSQEQFDVINAHLGLLPDPRAFEDIVK